MQDKDLIAFERTLMLSQESLKSVLYKYLKKKYKEVINTEHYLYSKGDIPIALVAHLDTVFKTPPTDVYYDAKKKVMWSPQGLGADDRAGVFAIIKILSSGLRPHVIFTTDEEIGGLGAAELVKNPCPFEDLRYIIELDRRGRDDCVFYYCDNIDFIEYVQGFNFFEDWGSFSDISILCTAWNVAGVNLSIGYEDEHSFLEILHTDYLLETIEKVKKMLTVEKIPSFIYIPKVYNKNSYFQVKCAKCGKLTPYNELYLIKTVNDKLEYYCEDCVLKDENHIKSCDICGEYYESDESDYEVNVCKDCSNYYHF